MGCRLHSSSWLRNFALPLVTLMFNCIAEDKKPLAFRLPHVYATPTHRKQTAASRAAGS